MVKKSGKKCPNTFATKKCERNKLNMIFREFTIVKKWGKK